MKRRITALFILSFMIVSLVAPIWGKLKTVKLIPCQYKIITQEKECAINAKTLNMVYEVSVAHNIKNDEQKETEEVKEETEETEDIVVEEIMNSEAYKEVNETELAINNMNAELAAISQIYDRKEYFTRYKDIVYRYSYAVQPPTTIYDCFTGEELNILFRVVQAEIGNYSFDQKCNVVSVIYNRLRHEAFPNVLYELLTPDQFQTIQNGAVNNAVVSDDTILACEYVFIFGDTTGGALFFDSNGRLNYNYLFNDGAHNFYNLGN